MPEKKKKESKKYRYLAQSALISHILPGEEHGMQSPPQLFIVSEGDVQGKEEGEASV